METEIEAKFLAVDFKEVRRKLDELGGVCEQPMRLMRRAIIETPEMQAKGAFVRIRDEGHHVTLTYKQVNTLSIDGTKETEVVVSDFDTTVRLLAAAGLAARSFQESRRETWRLGDVEVVLDEWPWLDPYVEIEGPHEALVREAAQKLDFHWNDAVFGGVMSAYMAQYTHLTLEHTVANIAEVRFDSPFPDHFKPQA